MVKNRKKPRVCLAASAGGHLSQLLRLTDSWEQYEAIYVSTLDGVAKKLQQLGRTYIAGECNRQHPFKTFSVLLQCIKVVLKERPDVVISTGAAPGFLICITAKMVGSKIIWIDSIANIQQLSMSGQLIRPFSNLILTQWPEVARKYKNVEYVGAII